MSLKSLSRRIGRSDRDWRFPRCVAYPALAARRGFEQEIRVPATRENRMPKATEVFSPNDTPTFSYVERRSKFEERLREALSIPKMIVSLSGPSKSGKTVLVNKVVEPDDLIPLSGDLRDALVSVT
jgi:hypothetical protein